MEESNNSIKLSIFEKENAVSQSASEIMRLIILQRLDEMLRAWENFLNSRENSSLKDKTSNRCRSSIKVLYAILKPRLEGGNKNHIGAKTFKENLELFNYEDCIDQIIEYLENDLKLTKIAINKEYNRANWEESIEANK